jgi:hypothetical protein
VNENLIDIIIEALKRIRNSRFYSSERGFEGELSSNLKILLFEKNIIPNEAIVEEEYQKTIPNHGIRHRPDILVHIPFEEGITRNRKEGNFVAIELKRKASKKKALRDFSKLNDYINILDYPLGVFVNVSSTESYIKYVSNNKIHVFNALNNQVDIMLIHSYLNDREIISETV